MSGMNLFKTFFFNLSIAADAILVNKLRTLLTALGIIFGVGAVITMLAIGTGAREEILNQMKLVGTNNIVIDPLDDKQQEEQSENSNEEKLNQKASPGLTFKDALAIKEILPTVSRISPEITLNLPLITEGKMTNGFVTGVSPDFFSMYNFSISEGQAFNDEQSGLAMPVCVIGKEIEQKFFSTVNPVGKQIKCGEEWMTVVGVLEDLSISEESMNENLGIRNYNKEIFVPVNTILLRFKNLYAISGAEVSQVFFGGGMMINSSSSTEDADIDKNEVDRIVVEISESDFLIESSEIIGRLLLRRHNGISDFEIKVPYSLLKQKQKAKQQYNIVLGAIAGISLLVGGIGIMNIMLASVLERVKEIGIRKAMGARKIDIIQQFLIEASLISFSGGIIGVFLGVSTAFLVERYREIATVVSFQSILLSFGVSVMIGIVFGFFPARKAAKQDVIESLRHE